MGAVAHPYGLTDAEFAAIVALQEGAPAPDRHASVWHALEELSLVWLDNLMRPPTIRLTPLGRRYPAG